MHNKLAEFERQVSIPPTSDDIRRLIKLDRINTQLVIHAEKKCRKLYMGAKPYTPEVNQLGAVINAWHVLIHKKEGKFVSSRWFKRCLKTSGAQNFSQLSIEDCIKQRSLAFQKYNSYGHQIEEKRDSWLDDLADAIAAKGNISKSAAVRQLKSREESSHTYRQIRVATKNSMGAPYHMELKKDGVSYVSTDKDEIEAALIEEYETKYHLAEASPFLQEPLLSDVGPLALGESANQILNGTYSCPSGVSKYTEKFISYLKKDEIVQEHNRIEITTEDSNYFWHKIKEKVSSSPSDRHYGTYKAACSHEGNAKIQAKLTSWPYQLGFPLPRTTNCINVSLLKKGKGITPSDLRTIWLLEADFNAGAKQHFVTRMMNSTALGNDLIPASQYAKRGSRAIEAALVKILYFDHIRQNKLPGVFFASDLMQCFDRMAHPVCSLVSQRWGVHPNVILCMFTAIQQMKHKIRTGFGDSDREYGNDHVRPLQGGGQGNGASLPLWVAISCILLTMLEGEVKGVRLRTAITLQCLVFIAIMYVDDTDILLTDITGNDTLDDVFRRAKKAAKVWDMAVLQTGGALRPEKCYWSAIDFRWKNGRWFYMPMRDFQEAIWVNDTNGVKQKVKRLDINNSREGLGVYINPDGSMGKQSEHVIDKITKWTTRLKASSLSRHHVYIDANTSIFKSITYLLPGSTFTPKECSHLESVLYKDLLPRLGVNSKMALPYRYATPQFQGAGMLHMHSQMMIEHIKLFLSHIHRDTQLGIMFRATMETLQLEVGSRTHPFQLPYQPFSEFATNTWMKVLWFCLNKYNITLSREQNNIYMPRENDVTLMDELVAAQRFTKSEMIRINRCRIYLQVYFLSDVTSGDGRKLMYQSAMGQLRHDWYSTWAWPRQQRPPEQDWKLWRIALHDVWTGSGGPILLQPLGNWVHKTHIKTKFYYDPKLAYAVVQKNDNSYDLFEPMDSRTRYGNLYKYTYSIFASRRRWIPVNGEYKDHDVVVIEPNMIKICRVFSKKAQSLYAYVATRPAYQKYLLQHSTIISNGAKLRDLILTGKIIAVADASVAQLTQTAAVSWIFADDNTNECAGGCSGCPQSYLRLDSYGCEMFGIYCILLSVDIICGYYNIKSGRLRLACDNDSSLEMGTRIESNIKVDQKYFDLRRAVNILLKKIPLQIIARKVKGHNEGSRRRLNKYEKLNILMDARAKSFRKKLESKEILHSPRVLHEDQFAIFIDNSRVSLNIEDAIKMHIQGSAMKRKLIEKGDMTPMGVQYTDWEATGRAAKTMTAHEKLWLAKFCSGFSPTASQMWYRELSRRKKEEKMQEKNTNEEKSDEESVNEVDARDKLPAPGSLTELSYWQDDLCPLCRMQRENTKHVITCDSEQATKYRNDSITLFTNWLRDQLTDPAIVSCFSVALKNHNSQAFSHSIKHTDATPLHHTAAMEQDEVGYVNFFFGRVSQKWRELQRRYFLFKYPTRKYSADAWIRRVIGRIYRMTRGLWKFRCEIVHGNEHVHTSRREKQKLQVEIKRQFDLGEKGLRATDKHYLRQSLNTILTSSVREQKYWLRSVQVSRAYMVEAEKNMFVGMRDVMRRWARLPD